MATDFIGSGIAYPLRIGAGGGLALVSQEREVEEAIRLILATRPGERPMRPEFGSRLADHVFAPANAATAGRLAYEVRTALDRWEPRITLDDVEVDFSDAQDGVLYLDIRYRLRGTNDPRNLVFPFYVIPDHEPSAGVATDTTVTPVATIEGGR
ncbi:MAG: GPW/gp25 family protein [Kineosporiaceae bacterium]|nr:GPW/gp25 family protein [Kineosporiaceae bacterium]MBK8077631.1 GPW/gp25 family protein [Kineosporiaceae bacterium]